MNVCPACNTINPETTIYCIQCGTKCTQINTAEIPDGEPQVIRHRVPSSVTGRFPPSEGLAISAFVVGAVSLFLALLSILFILELPFALLVGIVGLGLGLVSIRQKFTGFATAGIVLSVATILCVIVVVIIFVVLIYVLHLSSSVPMASDFGTKL